MKADLMQAWQDMDRPLEIPENISNIKKKGKLKAVLHYEDGSYKEFFIKLGADYYITIKKKKYLLIPQCIERGKQPAIHYYYNNPWPIEFMHTKSNLTALEFWSKKLRDLMPEDVKETLALVKVDAGVLHAAVESDWLKSMYARPGITTKMIILIIGAVLVIILILLQVTGTVDILGWISGAAGG